MDNLYQQSISKKQFFKDLELGKKVVDLGFKDYFVLLGNTSFKNTRVIGNTTLADIKELYDGAIYGYYRFALPHCEIDEDKISHVSSIRIRDITKKDKSKLRSDFKFFPINTYVAEMIDQKGFTMLYPFKQNQDGTIVPLFENNIYRQRKVSGERLQRIKQTMRESVFQEVERIIELLPDLLDSLLAVVKYKGVDICIPIEKSSAKKTFRTRDKDGERRSHIIHNVNQFGRNNLKNVDKVKSHLRGASDLVIDGVEVSLMASVEWSFRYFGNKCVNA